MRRRRRKRRRRRRRRRRHTDLHCCHRCMVVVDCTALHCNGPGSKHVSDFTPTVLESWNGNKDKNRNEDMHRNKAVTKLYN